MKKILQFLEYILSYINKKTVIFSGVLLILPKNVKNIIHDQNTRSNLFKSLFSIFVMNISRYSKKKKEAYKKTTFIDDKNKFSFLLDINDYTQCSVYLNSFGKGHRSLIHQIRICPNKDTMIDIGANVGFFSLFASHYFSKVISFEPTPQTFSFLKNNIRLSSIKNITALPYGISNKTGTGIITENPINQGGNSLNLNEEDKLKTDEYSHFSMSDFKKHTIELVTLDDFIKNNNINNVGFIKIDVEGHEEKALQGAKQTLEKFQPIVFCEVTSRKQFTPISNILGNKYLAFDPINMSEISENTSWDFRDVLFMPKDKSY